MTEQNKKQEFIKDFSTEKNKTIVDSNEKPVVIEKILTKKFKVIMIDKNYIIVEDENGNGICKQGNFNVKVGDTIEF